MEDLIIRSATIDDLLNIQKLNKILFELEYNNFDSTLDTSWPMSNEGEEYFKNAINNNIVLVSVLDDKIVGYLVGSLNTGYSYNKNIQAELDNMCILEECRKLGIGKQLFLEFKKICKKNNISELKVVASYDNLNAIKFYKNCGFAPSELTLKQNID